MPTLKLITQTCAAIINDKKLITSKQDKDAHSVQDEQTTNSSEVAHG